MELTLAEVMCLSVMQQARLVAGASHAAARVVSGVTVIEVPVEDFVRPGQLVLTTAMGVGHDEELFARFVEEVMAGGAAALGVAVGRYAQAIPPRVVRLSEEHGFPVIELPWELPFGQIIREVLERIIGKELAILRRTQDVNRTLTSALLAGGDLVTIAKALAGAVGSEVLVLDRRLRVIASSDGGLPSGGEAGNDALVVRLVTAGSDLGKATVSDSRTGTAEGAVVAPIVAGGELFGYFALLGAEENALGEAERQALQQACAATAVYFLRERAVAEVRLRLVGDFVWALASGRLNDEREAASIAAYLGYDLGRCFRGIVWEPDEFRSYVERQRLDEGEIGCLKRRLGEIVRVVASRRRVQVMVTSQQDRLVCFLEDLPGGPQAFSDLLGEVNQEVGNEFPGIGFSCGVGGAQRGLSGFPRSYDEACKALDFGRAIRCRRWLGLYDSLAVLRVLLQAASSEDASRLIDKYVLSLLRHAGGRSRELLETVRVLMEAGWNTSRAARCLHLHRQSLLYRLERVRAVAGWDPWDPQDRFSFQLAFMLHSLREHQEEGKGVARMEHRMDPVPGGGCKRES